MKYLHYNFNLSDDDVVVVTLDKQANVRLMDNSNYQNYKSGRRHRFYGGGATQSPVRISPPHGGHWHLVIDTGGYAGTVRASVNITKG